MSAKSKFTSADVRAMVRDVRRACVGKRVANIYDISDKMYLFKFSATGGEKGFLVLESGVRFHTTKYTREHAAHPSPFAMKLRGLLATKRLDDIAQLGFDRVVHMRFGSGEYVNHLILELYAGGNIVVTDANFEVVALLRSHEFSSDIKLKVGEIYPMAHSTNLSQSLSLSVHAGPLASESAFKAFVSAQIHAEVAPSDDTPATPATPATPGKAPKAKKMPNLRQVLLSRGSGVGHLGPELIEHCLVSAELPANAKLAQVLQWDSAQFERLTEAFRSAERLVESLSTESEGFIVCKTEGGDYIEYTPCLFAQHRNAPTISFPTFSEAVDTYYFKLEDQKAQQAAQSQAEAARKKLQKVKEEQERLIQDLTRKQKVLELSGRALMAHAEDVEKAMLVINSLLANGMAWDDIEDVVEVEQAQGNRIALLISELKLSENKIIVRFPLSSLEELIQTEEELSLLQSQTDEDDDFEVEVDLNLSAFSNAENMFQHRKAASVKEEKTIRAASQVIKAVKEQTDKTLEKITISTKIRAIRKIHWFEKFNWFITSEGFLVLSGKDAQQNELLYSRYLRPFDIYVHADVHGASSCVVRAKRHDPQDLENKHVSSVDQEFFVSPLAIQEAGAMAVCRSKAWTNKYTASAYWVKASQVSKTPPSGEFLTTGAFMIYGKKNYLPPMALEMGFGLMFRLHDESVGRHLKDRKVRSYELDTDKEAASLEETLSRYALSAEMENDHNDENNENENENDDEAVVEELEVEENNANKDDAKDLELQEIEDDDVLKEEKEENEEQEWDEGEEEEHENEEEEEDVEDKREREKEEKTNKPSVEERHQEKKGKKGKSNKEEKNAKKGIKSGKEQKTAQKDIQDDREARKEKEEGSVAASQGKTIKKKTLNKKKARRYAEQDDEDRELAMMVLGHASQRTGETLEDRRQREEKERKSADLKTRQSKAGIQLVRGNWENQLSQLAETVKNALLEMVAQGLLREGEIEDAELRTLATLTPEMALRALTALQDEPKLSSVKNKSGLLAAIMRRVVREQENRKIISPDAVAPPDVSRLTLEEQQEVLAIQSAEGMLEAEEGKQADEVEKLTSQPVAEDVLLYAIPVCAPYMSMQSFKFKVKLTPGPMKKGKAVKLALHIFSKSADPNEKALFKLLNENEMVSAMLGDVKVSTPGLHQLQKHKKQRGQKK